MTAPGADAGSAGARADGGTPGADGGAVTNGSFCVTAPWTNAPAQLAGPGGATNIPAGTYTLRYVGGAQSHDIENLYGGGGYEVTAHYLIDGLEAGHHLYNGADPATSSTSLWLDANGLVSGLPDVASVERANAGHTWSFVHAGGPLFMTYYDNDYGGNVGPGSRFCVDVGGASLPPGTSIIDPAWQRSNEYFLAPSLPNANLQYYATNTYPLFHEDDSPAPPAFTWTTSAAWNGPSTTDMPVSGPSTIPGFVANDTWFWTRDRVGDGVTGTTYWFRANVDLGTKTKLARVTLSDKYHPGRIAVNDGIIVFLNGVAQPIMPNVSASTYAPGVMRDDTETGWSFDGVTLSLDALHDGLNEIAVMYDERFGEGGLGHLVLSVTAGDRAVDQAARRPRTA